MKLPHPKGGRETAARTSSRTAGRRRYPTGKALARIRYFERQRGTSHTRYVAGQVITEPLLGVAPRRAAKRAPAKSGRVSYAEAAAKKLKLEPPHFAAAVNLPVWRELGPTLIPHGQTYGTSEPAVSGRCNGIYVDPTDARRLVLSSAGGGLWGSMDTGATWQPLTDYAATLSMGAIAAAPSSPNIVYAGTGEADSRVPLGMGLMRSSDAGRTWAHVPLVALAGVAIYDLAVDPQDPLHVWIATVNGLFETRDGGDSVRRARAKLAWDVSIDPANPRDIFTASEDGLQRSTNGGGTWTRVPLSGTTASTAFERMEVCHAPSNGAVVYVAAATAKQAMLWRGASANGTFSRETVPTKMDVSQAWYDWCFAVSPADPNVVCWGAIELYRGTRGSGNLDWTKISSRNTGDSIHPDQHHVAFDPVNARTIYACNDGGLFRSPDVGATWQSLNVGLGITEFEFLSQLENEDAWIVGGTQDNGTLAYKGAKGWEQIAPGDGGDCAAIDASAPLSLHSYYGMWIERGAATGPKAFEWKDVSPVDDENFPALFYPPMEICGRVVAKAGKTVFVSDDAGDNWQELELPTSRDSKPDIATAMAVVGARDIFVGTEKGGMYRITRAANGWAGATVKTLGSPRDGYISDIVVPGAADGTVWATSSTFGGAHVLRSTNGGASWSNRTGNLPDIPVNALVADPANSEHLYAATDNGVYRSTDAGAKWLDFSNGLPNALVGDLVFHARLRLLRAGTRNRGCWEVKI
jgi:photosystem II stability/assembly factor-like uncharacterized protein